MLDNQTSLRQVDIPTYWHVPASISCKSEAQLSRDWRTLLRWFTFLAWVLGVTLVAFHHEPWRDEAQVWLIASESTPVSLLTHYLCYEGSPGLWHLLLMPLARLGAPYWTVRALSVALVASGVWLLLFKTKLPLALAVLFPFGFWFFYHYAVVARSYCLLLPLGLLVALAYPKRNKRRWPGRCGCLLTSHVEEPGVSPPKQAMAALKPVSVGAEADIRDPVSLGEAALAVVFWILTAWYCARENLLALLIVPIAIALALPVLRYHAL